MQINTSMPYSKSCGDMFLGRDNACLRFLSVTNGTMFLLNSDIMDDSVLTSISIKLLTQKRTSSILLSCSCFMSFEGEVLNIISAVSRNDNPWVLKCRIVAVSMFCALSIQKSSLVSGGRGTSARAIARASWVGLSLCFSR